MDNQLTQYKNFNPPVALPKKRRKLRYFIIILVICIVVVATIIYWWREKIIDNNYFNRWGTYITYKLGFNEECKGAGMMILKNKANDKVKQFDPFCSTPPWYKKSEWTGFIAVE